jgi:hypothetical protein
MDVSLIIFIFALVVGGGAFIIAHLMGDKSSLLEKEGTEPFFSLNGYTPFFSFDEVGEPLAFPSDDE